MFVKLGELWRDHTGAMIGAIGAIAAAILLAGIPILAEVLDNDEASIPTTDSGDSPSEAADTVPPETDPPADTVPPETDPPAETDPPRETDPDENPNLDYNELVRSGNTFYVAFSGSELCSDIGELGAIQLGQVYELKWIIDEEVFRAEGPSQAEPNCADHSAPPPGMITNLGAGNEVRLSIWGVNDLRFDAQTGVVVLNSSPAEVVGRICESKPGCTGP